MNANLDLRGLAVRRDADGRRPPGRPRNLATRYLLPAVLVAGFAAVMTWAARDVWLSSRPVTVVPVLATKAQVREEGTPLFNAAGWVEPRPTPVNVTALAEGVVEELLVVEGQQVRAGDPVARLIAADAQLENEEAMATLMLQEAEVERAEAVLEAAETNLQYPVTLEAELAEAEAVLAKTETELANVPFEKQEAEARVRFAQLDYEGKRGAGEGISARSLQKAQSELAAATAALDRIEVRQPRLEREVEALAAKRDALARRLELKTEETRAVAEAKAELAAAGARVRQAQAICDRNELTIARLTVRAPISGRVLALAAHPGSRVMGIDPGGLHDASTVVTMYDPDMLQVRADVRLENVPQVQPGQKVRIETEALKQPLEGEVLSITSVADIQKNTLQVKVAIPDPPSVLKPEMLVQATFLAQPSVEGKAARSEELRLFVPKALVEAGADGSSVWIADQAAGVARRKAVKLGRAVQGDLMEVVEGLQAGDRLIVQGRDGLKDGERIAITAEDER
jgi:HlyD family secretion protein